MRFLPVFTLSLATLAGAALPAAAQDRYFNFSLRGGVAGGPSYPGADSYRASPDVGFTFGALRFGSINAGNGIGEIPDNGLSLRGAFRVVGDRTAKDNPELAGLDDINAAAELGVGVIYRQSNWQAYMDVRQGFGGHHGVTATAGADLILRPNDRWTITAGPRLNGGDSEYAQTYFGVPVGTGSAFAPFDAGGGLLGVGFEVEATYELNDTWSLEGALAYQKLKNDAADSPITTSATGSDDQWTLRFGLSRAFTLRF